MAQRSRFTVLIAADGSAEATAAVRATAAFPWPSGARVEGLVVRSTIGGLDVPESVWAEVDRGTTIVAEETRTALTRRWPAARVRVVDGPTVDAIQAHARRIGASVVVVGSRGHGPVARLLLGSTSLGIVRGIRRAALVVRGRPTGFTRIALGVDGSAHSRRAAAFLAGLAPPAGGRVTVVSVFEPLVVPSLGLIPRDARAAIRAQADRENAASVRKLRQRLEPVAEELRRAGWKADVVIRQGAPLHELLAATAAARAQLLAVGARGKGGVERLLLGSVCEGALHRAPVSVLVVR